MLSIVIPTYRGAARLARLLPTINANDNADVELLVADDGSPGNEGEAIKEVVAKSPITRKRTLRFDENCGMVAVMKLLLEEARGELVLQLDDDVLVPAGLITTMSHLLEQIPNVGVLSWRSLGRNPGQSRKSAVGFLEPATQLAGYCMAYRRSVYDEVGGVDTRFRMYCSDSDFALRVCMAGHPCYRVWWPLVPHEEHAAFSGGDFDRGGIAARDLAAFQAKWGNTGEEMEKKALSKLRLAEGAT